MLVGGAAPAFVRTNTGSWVPGALAGTKGEALVGSLQVLSLPSSFSFKRLFVATYSDRERHKTFYHRTYLENLAVSTDLLLNWEKANCL